MLNISLKGKISVKVETLYRELLLKFIQNNTGHILLIFMRNFEVHVYLLWIYATERFSF